MVILKPCQGASGGTENPPAPNDQKLGRLRCARQGLVRVPESNTKYGGKGGITGGKPTPVRGPSIGESSGFPKGKKLSAGCGFELRPALHGAAIYGAAGLAWARLTPACRGRSGMRLRRWPPAPITGMFGIESSRPSAQPVPS